MRPPVLITAPTDDVLTVDECKTMLNITSDGQDDMIEAAISAVVDTLDPASGGWLDRALRPQTWEYRLDSFHCREIRLPFPVLTALTSVKYDDIAGVEQTLTLNTAYRVFGLGGHFKASIAPAYNTWWPATRCYPESVRIRYVCGYTGAAMPAAIKNAVAVGVRMVLNPSERNLFLSQKKIEGVSETRWVVSDIAAKVLKDAMDNLLSTYWVP